MGGRIGWWWLAGTRKWPERVAAVAKTDSKNSLTGGDCGGPGGHDGYDWKAGREAVMGVPVWWLGEVRRLAGSGSKWWRRKGGEFQNYEILEINGCR